VPLPTLRPLARPRRAVAALAALALVTTGAAVIASSSPVAAVPVAVTDAQYDTFGRVFPDPHGCLRGAPGTSPWAKGDVCATQFAQWDETLAGLRYLEQRFPRYLQVQNLRTMFGDHPAFTDQSFQSAGLPRTDLSRLKRDLYVVKVTDRESAVPEADRRHFAYSLSIHGIERAGVEGGVRAIEDLVSWAACEGGASAPACAAEGPFPKRILEPSDSGPTAGQVLRNGVVYFVFANPDGWHRGEATNGGVFFQRYNGNGMDLNRDWPSVGYTEAQYTPFSEPETRGYAAYLKWVAERTTEGRFAGAIDLHGMLDAPSFSFTLLGAGQRDYRKNAVSVDTSITTFRDSEDRLTWSPLIGRSESCGDQGGIPGLEGTLPMCSDQWGTVWDTINYQVAGSFGDWMDSPIGLDAVGIDNEMALSHLAPNNVFDPQVEQLHIDGNKGLIYAQIASLLDAETPTFTPTGKIGYIFDPARIRNPGGGPADGSLSDLPTQDDIAHTNATGIQEFAFEVKGPQEGVHNGGLAIEATFGNVDGMSTNSAAELILDYCGPGQHPGEDGGECREIARYFNQSAAYLQAGARIDLNDPPVGPYRIRAAAGRALPTKFEVSFSRLSSYPEPQQAPYDVSRMDFFTDLNKYVPTGSELVAIPVKDVLRKPRTLARFDTIVAANALMPGFIPEDEWRVAEPAGTPQPDEEFGFGAGSVPGAPATHEFEVADGFDNDRMVVTSSWELPSDYDMYLDFRNPETGVWEERGCECSFVNNGETVTVVAPESGTWRIRMENFAAAPQPVTGRVRFEAMPSPGNGPGEYTAREFDRYAGNLAGFASGGGNLVLTDGAMAALPFLGTELAPGDIDSGVFYAGWMDFDAGDGPTYGSHHLARGVDKEGTAEGRASIEGQRFDNRHQTYEPVPLGYYVGPGGSSNSACTSDRCDSPNWVVKQQSWEDAGGTTAARTLVRESVTPGSSSTTGASLGELPYGSGTIRIAGGLLPDPTEQNHHPFGLFSYALTYTGYQVMENLLDHRRR
jgi:hypothetical protein